MALDLEGHALKFEIVSEGRIDLRCDDDTSLPVARLCDADLVAEKLLANEDRHLDDSALGRDAIDLLMLEHTLGSLPAVAWDKARGAYGPSVDRAWTRALRRLRDSPSRLARGLDAMAVRPDARALIEAKIAAIPASDDG